MAFTIPEGRLRTTRLFRNAKL